MALVGSIYSAWLNGIVHCFFQCTIPSAEQSGLAQDMPTALVEGHE